MSLAQRRALDMVLSVIQEAVHLLRPLGRTSDRYREELAQAVDVQARTLTAMGRGKEAGDVLLRLSRRYMAERETGARTAHGTGDWLVRPV
ncbi:hypothetical protein AB0B50_28335 [Streptomyces sp. NPDC041068]|uniref:hypothetical protein n=1 Tax=Streptomyces sp. NPDC041068 TaxID=3155130 RepID=UPI0033EECA1B